MRTDIEQRILDAFSHPLGVGDVEARVEGARARHFSTSFNDDYAAAFAQAPGIWDSPVPQDVAAIDGVLVTVANYGSELWIMDSFQAPFRPTISGVEIACDAYCRPGIARANDNLAVIYYSQGAAIWRAEIDMALAFSGVAECASNREQVYSFSKYASLHALGAWQVMAVYVDDGGVRTAWLEASGGVWALDEWRGRFVAPGQAFLEADTGHRACLNFSAASRLDDVIYVYLSMPDGSVAGVSYNTANTVWSDSFEAVSSDLSRFACAKAFEYNEKIYLGGQFQRVDEQGGFDSPWVWGLLFASDNGRRFSIDRNTAFSGGNSDTSTSAALRWLCLAADEWDSRYGLEDGGVIYSDANRWMAQAAHYGLTGICGEYSIGEIISVSGDVGSSFEIRIANADGRYDDTICVGDAINIDLGVYTSINVMEWFTFMRCMVTQKRFTYADGERSLVVTAVPWTMARLEEMTHPFGLSLNGREAIRDGMDDLSNFERAAEEGYLVFPLAADFWDRGGEISPATQDAGEETVYTTGDLKRVLDLVEYPEIEALPIEVELYGWSRSGSPTPDTGGTGDQPSNLNAPNDKMIARLVILRDDEEVEVDITEPETPHDHFPQTWYKTDDGSYPVILQARAADGLQVGDQITQVKMVFQNTRTPDTAETTFFAERIEIPDVSMKCKAYEETWEAIQPEKVDKIAVIWTDKGVFYTEDFDTETPTWRDFNDGLSAGDLTTIAGLEYDWMRNCYYLATTASGIYRVSERGGEWALLFSNETAQTKIDAAGGMCTPLSADNYGYEAIHVDDRGGVYAVGGARGPGGGCALHKRIFYSANGLATLDVGDHLAHEDGDHQALQVMGSIVGIGGGNRTLLTYVCAAGVGSDSHLGITDDNGVVVDTSYQITAWTTAPDYAAEAGNEVIYYRLGQSAYKRTSDGYPWDDKTFPAVVAAPSGHADMRLVAASKIDSSIIAASLTNGVYQSLDGGTVFAKISESAAYCLAASAAVAGQWLAGYQGTSSLVKQYQGGAWVDRTGNLGALIGETTEVRKILSLPGKSSNDEEADSGQELLRVGAPVVYFSQTPYFAINCQVEAKYFLEGDNAYGGVVCLASDGENYIAARASIDAVELIRSRGGLGVTLDSASYTFPKPYGWIMLRYVDGNFEVRIKDALAREWSAPLIGYAWTETDGQLLTDPESSHVGLYAVRDAPYVRICGMDLSMTANVGILPGAHLMDDFPSGGGKIRVEDCLYDYSSKSVVALPEGPYQGRNVSGPYGYTADGVEYLGYAAEFTRFEWVDNSAHSDDYDDAYMSSDTGVVWEITDVDYHPWITYEQAPVYLKNRGRFFGPAVTGDVIGANVQVWLTHALLDIVQAAGEPTTHAKGSIAYLVNDSIVRVFEFSASSGTEDLTDRDAIAMVCEMAGGEAEFAGDIQSTLVLGVTEETLVSATAPAESFDLMTGGFDMALTMPEIGVGEALTVRFSTAIVDGDAQSASLRIERTATGIELTVKDADGATVDLLEREASMDWAGGVDVRITARNQALSVVVNGWWLHTFMLRYVKHAETPSIFLTASAGSMILVARLTELADGHDQIWIDVDASAMNVIASVTGARPIRVRPTWDGNLNYFYVDQGVSTYGITSALTVEIVELASGRAASDALVFGEQTGVIGDEQALEDVGFVTRAYRYNQLDHGALAAARVKLQDGRRDLRQVRCGAIIRPEIELFDAVHLEAIFGAGVSALDETFEVNRMGISIRSGEAKARIEGRCTA